MNASPQRSEAEDYCTIPEFEALAERMQRKKEHATEVEIPTPTPNYGLGLRRRLGDPAMRIYGRPHSKVV